MSSGISLTAQEVASTSPVRSQVLLADPGAAASETTEAGPWTETGDAAQTRAEIDGSIRAIGLRGKARHRPEDGPEPQNGREFDGYVPYPDALPHT